MRNPDGVSGCTHMIHVVSCTSRLGSARGLQRLGEGSHVIHVYGYIAESLGRDDGLVRSVCLAKVGN